MPAQQAVAIRRYDVVVVGGGVAGIAIAELLARRTDLSIKVVEQAPKLGTGASGKLEGWFHAGALYSGADDAQTFLNCLNGLEDLINLYSSHFRGRCNMVLHRDDGARARPTVEAAPGGWFHPDPIHYLLPAEDSPDVASSRLKNDRVLLDIHRQRVMDRLEAAFGNAHDWGRNGRCLAPTYAQIEDALSETCSLIERSGVLNDLCARFDASFGLSPTATTVLRSRDVTMDTDVVMRDLVASALARGVDIECDLASVTPVMERFGPLRVKSLSCESKDGRRSHLRARLFVFAVGAGFKSFLPELHLRVRLKTSKSAMVVACPQLTPHSFVRTSIKNRFHFNHLAKRGVCGDHELRYSMLANSGFTGDGDDALHDVDAILESAERYFGDELYARQLYSYDCDKTEFIAEEDEKRRYSYWIEAPDDGNYLCVLPGKFSFFPTVAYQTFLRVTERIQATPVPGPERFAPDAAVRRRARGLVAEHFPLRLLAAEGAEANEAPPRPRPMPRSAETGAG